MLEVHKYGGTCLSDASCIRLVAKNVARALKDKNGPRQLVLVVSAMGQTTDELLRLASEVSSNPAPRELDMLLSAGERTSMALVALALNDLGIPAVSFTGSQTGILTTEHHQNARIDTILGHRVKQALASNRVAIIAGFQGMSRTKEITTLGRGGSDTTAIAMSASLGARCCRIFTDVLGIYSANPHLVEAPRLFHRIRYDWMLEMAEKGAGVLDVRGVSLARKHQLPVWIGLGRADSSYDIYSQGTWMTKDLQSDNDIPGIEKAQIIGVTSRRDRIYLEVQFETIEKGMLLWSELEDLFVNTIDPLIEQTSIKAFVPTLNSIEGKRLEERLVYLRKEKKCMEFKFRKDLMPVTAVGDCFSTSSGLVNQVIQALNKAGITPQWIQKTSLSLTLGIEESKVDQTVRIIHRDLIESNLVLGEG